MYLQIYTRKASKDLENYQLVVLGLIALSKIYKTCTHKSVVPFVDDFSQLFYRHTEKLTVQTTFSLDWQSSEKDPLIKRK